MEQYQAIIEIIALSMGVAWASGINLYAVLLVLGLGGASGNIALPTELALLENPLVIGAAGLMYMVEFGADKIPGVDTVWDTLHTFVRLPAGAMLAAASIAPAGKRTKVWSVSQTVSTPGILSAPNSTIYISPAAPMTNGFSSKASSVGRAMFPDAPPSPSTSSTAYRFMPLAQATPMLRAMISIMAWYCSTVLTPIFFFL